MEKRTEHTLALVHDAYLEVVTVSDPNFFGTGSKTHVNLKGPYLTLAELDAQAGVVAMAQALREIADELDGVKL